jgi:RNA polymerase sigma-70 factor, ECF subfamily
MKALKEILGRTDGTNQMELKSNDDASLVMAAQGGDHAAFGRLFERHKRAVLLKAMQIVKNLEDAEDLAQQTFQNAFVHLQQFEGRSSFSTWLVRIVINQAFMLKRTAWRCRARSIDEPRESEQAVSCIQIEDWRPDPEQDCSQREQALMLYRAIKRLSPRMRLIVQMYDLEERSARETAQNLGRSVTAVKSMASRGRRLLRQKLQRKTNFQQWG